METINSPAEGRFAYRSAPCAHGYPMYAGHGKRPVLSRVPTHFRPESPRSRRKTLCFQYGGCPGRAQICLLTANSGLALGSNAVMLEYGQKVRFLTNKVEVDTLMLAHRHNSSVQEIQSTH
jgi:hypothetical protein